MVIPPKFVAGFILCLAAAPFVTSAADTDGAGFWRETSESAIAAPAALRRIVPERYRTLTLDLAGLRARLAAAPPEATPAAAETTLLLALPMPGGGFERFRIVESPVMEPALAAQFPQIRTYSGQGIDDPTATARLDFTELGFHAQVLDAGRADYIDPYAAGDLNHYLVYRRDDYPRKTGESTPFRCDVRDPDPDADAASAGSLPPAPHYVSGATRRTYRLALAATGEYTTFVCAPNPAAAACGLSAMTTSMNRVNGIYEREVAIRMNMVANNNLIVYTNGGSDPYTNTSCSSMLSQNVSNLNSVIGSANFDIGHVFSTGGGGVASLNVPCTGSKASGCTGTSNPVGDPFDVDYVAHEMGHQWGGLHTFNGTTTNCGGGNRSGSAAYEPGSGSTIMSYAGICAAENLQPHSDPYFHAKSIEQIINFSTGATGSGCAAQAATGNQPPTVSAGAAFTIPRSTPFTLTAIGGDPDGDALTFGWEEYDLGLAAPPNDDVAGARPILRSFNPTVSPSRTFPKLSDILAGSLGTGFEILPSISRTMTFRVTARDNRAGGGGVRDATTTVTVSSGAGPFAVTAPNTALTWPALSAQTVAWNVANTTAAPVSAANVNIRLSADGGQTFPYLLAAATPNDGSATVLVPNAPTTTARVRVEGAGNIFFDLSNTNFTITSPPPIKEASLSGNFRLAKGAGTALTATYTAACGSTDHVIYRGLGPIVGAVSWGAAHCALGVSGSALFDPGAPAPGQLQYFVIAGQNGVAEGSYGRDSSGSELPEADGVGSCDKPQSLGGTCP